MDEKLITKVLLTVMLILAILLLILDTTLQLIQYNRNETTPSSNQRILFKLINGTLANERN